MTSFEADAIFSADLDPKDPRKQMMQFHRNNYHEKKPSTLGEKVFF